MSEKLSALPRSEKRSWRSVKWATGSGAALSVFGVLSAITGDPGTVLGVLGALLLGVGVATEWRD